MESFRSPLLRRVITLIKIPFPFFPASPYSRLFFLSRSNLTCKYVASLIRPPRPVISVSVISYTCSFRDRRQLETLPLLSSAFPTRQENQDRKDFFASFTLLTINDFQSPTWRIHFCNVRSFLKKSDKASFSSKFPVKKFIPIFFPHPGKIPSRRSRGPRRRRRRRREDEFFGQFVETVDSRIIVQAFTKERDTRRKASTTLGESIFPFGLRTKAKKGE